MAAYKLSKDSEGRDHAIQEALLHATEIPSRTGNSAAEALKVLEDLRSIIHANVASDFQIGLQMLRSSIRGAIANMRINLENLNDSGARSRYEDMIASWENLG